MKAKRESFRFYGLDLPSGEVGRPARGTEGHRVEPRLIVAASVSARPRKPSRSFSTSPILTRNLPPRPGGHVCRLGRPLGGAGLTDITVPTPQQASSSSLP
jgi:hypothetical protein